MISCFGTQVLLFLDQIREGTVSRFLAPEENILLRNFVKTLTKMTFYKYHISENCACTSICDVEQFGKQSIHSTLGYARHQMGLSFDEFYILLILLG